MSTSVELPAGRTEWEPPPAKPLDEAAWQAWVAKGCRQERRDKAARVKAVTWVSIAALLAATGLWSYVTPYEVVVRFIVAAGAVVVMLQAFHVGHYALASALVALALFYNPVAPAFGFSGTWQHAFVLASTAPFLVSLVSRNVRRPG
jgi:hypothetical protein